MEELTFKDLTEEELNRLKDIYIASRLNSMNENDLRLFVKQIIEDQIKGTVGNAEEKEAWLEMKEHFSEDFPKIIGEMKSRGKKNEKNENKSPEEIEFDKRLNLLERQQQSQAPKDMW